MNAKLEQMMKVSAEFPVVLQADDDVEGGMLCKLTGTCGVTCEKTCTGSCPVTG